MKSPKPWSMVAQTHLPLILERPIHRFLCCCFTLALLLCVNASRADEPAAPATTAATLAPSRRIEVRLSMSRAAAEALGEARIRRLLELELDDVGTLAQAPGGPLGDFVAHVWLDVLSPPQVLIEARFAERPVTRRFIAIEGLTSDVSARLVAIAANELVRAQARPIRPRKETKPRPPTAQEIELAKRLAPAIVWSVGPSVAFQPMSSGFIWGPNVSLGFRAMGATERIFARWLTGTTTAGSTRWLEVGMAADYRVWLGKSVRLSFGADAAFGFLRLGDVRMTDGIVGNRDTWSGRAGGIFGIDVRAFRLGWVGLQATPGVILRPAPFEDASGQRGALGGFWLGLDATLQIEHLLSGFASTTPH